ncbi:MAG: hypothetical protein LBR80_00485, partial [Deltaproteobacteria bacterium]|nr:hypothetical protein [Deltaproteobacteria bacterium]
AYLEERGADRAVKVAAFSAEGKLLWDRQAGGATGFSGFTPAALPGWGWVGSAEDFGPDSLFGIRFDGTDAWLVEVPRDGQVFASAPAGGDEVAAAGLVRDAWYRGAKGMRDLHVALADTAGNIRWAGNLVGSGADWANAASGLADGGLLVAGYTESLDGDLAALPYAGQGEGSPSAGAVKLGP